MIDAVTLGVMANRLDGIVREMTNTMVRTARSTTMAARDFSCSVTDFEHEMVSCPEGAPVHVYGSSLLAQAMWTIAPSISVADLFGIDGIPGAPPGLAINPLVNRYKTRDGRWLQMVFLQPDRFWAGFCERIGLPELATDERVDPRQWRAGRKRQRSGYL